MTVRQLIAALEKQHPDAQAWFGWKRCEPVSEVQTRPISELAGDFSAEEARNYEADSERTVVLIY